MGAQLSSPFYPTPVVPSVSINNHRPAFRERVYQIPCNVRNHHVSTRRSMSSRPDIHERKAESEASIFKVTVHQPLITGGLDPPPNGVLPAPVDPSISSPGTIKSGCYKKNRKEKWSSPTHGTTRIYDTPSISGRVLV